GGNDLDDFIVIEVAPQLCEMSIVHGVRHLSSSLREPQSGAFGIAEFGAHLELPHLLNLARRDTTQAREIPKMHDTILILLLMCTLLPLGDADYLTVVMVLIIAIRE